MDLAEYQSLYLKHRIFLRSLELHTGLEPWIVKFLIFHELTDKELSIYHKMKTDAAKLGYLMRKIVKTARRVGVHNTIIKEYLDVKDTYKYKKRVPSVDIEATIANERVVLYDLYLAGYRNNRQYTDIRNMYLTTVKLIRCILDIEVEKIKND